MDVLAIYDSFFEEQKEKVLSRLSRSANSKKSKYDIDKAKFDLCVSLISKIYNVNRKALKNRSYAHSLNAINNNYREASGMLYFILLNHLNWSWKNITTYFKTNNYAIHTYVIRFEESKKKQTKERYMYVLDKIQGF